MTLKEQRDRLRLRAREAQMERHVLSALRGLQADAFVAQDGRSASVESLPSRLVSAAGLIRRSFTEGYGVARKEIEAWRRNR